MPFGKFFQRKMSAAEKRVACIVQTSSSFDLSVPPVNTATKTDESRNASTKTSSNKFSKKVSTKNLSTKNRTGATASAALAGPAEQAQPNVPAVAIRGSPEYSVAFELEVWKKAEETKFRAHLKEQENLMRDQLDRAFAEKEKARELQWGQQQREFSNVESRLRKQLGEVQQREARVASEEDRLKRTYDLQTHLLYLRSCFQNSCFDIAFWYDFTEFQSFCYKNQIGRCGPVCKASA
jgi:hypothetical protein